MMGCHESTISMAGLFASGCNQNIALIGGEGSGRPILVRKALRWAAAELKVEGIESRRVDCAKINIFPFAASAANDLLSIIPDSGRGVLMLDNVDKASEQVQLAVMSLMIDRSIKAGDQCKDLPAGWTTVLFCDHDTPALYPVINQSIVLQA